jgi:glycosyltransferase involved in cell wall biosynthesis
LAAFRATALPHWRLLVAGTGEPRYVEQLKADHADPRIEFLGRQEPATFYLRLDATVVPSLLNEALGNVVFESLVHGRPVLGSRRGGIPEMLADGETGLLFDPETEGDLASALQRFADDVDVWRARHAAIKSIAAPRYCDIDAWISRWESLLKEVSGAGNAGCSS